MAKDTNLLKLQPGTIVNGRYEIIKCLGTGSMGLVYSCRHRELADHIVAMKVLFAEVARDEVARTRFINEIIASYGVSHSNVVRAYEYFHDGEIVAFTMEYVDGGDLADRLSKPIPVPINQAITWLKQMCSGVQAIHDAGIIHRDLKPENILLTKKEEIKITDFGIARTGTGPKLTEYGGVVGTIDYVSPEYLERGQVDNRSDIYALGVLAYEMVTNVIPFQGQSVIETMTLRLKTIPEAPINIRLDCPEVLSNIIMQALRRDPNQRYQTAREILRDLEDLEWSNLQGIDYGNYNYEITSNDLYVNNNNPVYNNNVGYSNNANSNNATQSSTPETNYSQGNNAIPDEQREVDYYQEIVNDPRYKEIVKNTRQFNTPKLNVNELSRLISEHKDESKVKKFLYVLIYIIIITIGYFMGVTLFKNWY
ncbi:MAG: serine/threonine protein kinase [Deltaproteobacteria bacterium]|jgi:serine/threonine protein kinase|nr:serine/threonine protein kinase [Deltaproteobacteria bacterium]